MSIKASTTQEAMRFLDKENVLRKNIEYSERAGYPTYFPYGDSSIDYRVTDLGCRVEVAKGGETQNIWIEEKLDFNTVVIGLIEEKKVFSSVTINEVTEFTCYCQVRNKRYHPAEPVTCSALSRAETPYPHPFQNRTY